MNNYTETEIVINDTNYNVVYYLSGDRYVRTTSERRSVGKLKLTPTNFNARVNMPSWVRSTPTNFNPVAFKTVALIHHNCKKSSFYLRLKQLANKLLFFQCSLIAKADKSFDSVKL
jgi:hypothetical protein